LPPSPSLELRKAEGDESGEREQVTLEERRRLLLGRVEALIKGVQETRSA